MGEDRRQDGDAEHAAHLADGVVGAGGDALFLRPDGAGHDQVGDGREEERHADAAMTNGGSRSVYGTSGDVIGGEPAERRWPAGPARSTSSGRPPMRSDSAPAIGATIIGMPVQGSIRRPASSGRVALDDLEELG